MESSFFSSQLGSKSLLKLKLVIFLDSRNELTKPRFNLFRQRIQFSFTGSYFHWNFSPSLPHLHWKFLRRVCFMKRFVLVIKIKFYANLIAGLRINLDHTNHHSQLQNLHSAFSGHSQRLESYLYGFKPKF